MKKENNRLKSKFYKWHRVIGLIALVPVICWTLSGLSHPFMSNWFRPFIPDESYNLPTQQQLHPQLSLQQVLDTNHIAALRNFKLVSLNNATYYQVLTADSIYQYYSANNAMPLPEGDKKYAVSLARYFTQDSVSAIKAAVLQTSFDTHYQPINHLLPVWKISFGRTDGMDIYVETGQSRLATFNNNTRKFFLVLFEQLHTWDWLAALGGDKLRLWTLMAFVGMMFLSMLSGLTVYGLFWKRFKIISQKRKENHANEKRFTHRFHRQLGLIVSFVMLTFLLSAGFHIAVKLHHINPEKKPFEQLIARQQLIFSNLQLPAADSTVVKQGLVQFNGKVYYQLLTQAKQIIYCDAATGKTLANGDSRYAAYLTGYYSGKPGGPQAVNPISQFTEEYGFINKRLPVEQVSYAGKDDWYIETSTAKLAAHVAGIDRWEGFSFIFLHKYFGMTWAGKDIRDIVSMAAALGVLVVSLFGFISFIKNK